MVSTIAFVQNMEITQLDLNADMPNVSSVMGLCVCVSCVWKQASECLTCKSSLSYVILVEKENHLGFGKIYWIDTGGEHIPGVCVF